MYFKPPKFSVPPKTMSISHLDMIYRRLLFTKLFTRGWGHPEHIAKLMQLRKALADRSNFSSLVKPTHPIKILKEHTWTDCKLIEGKFLTPLCETLPGVVPEEIQDAYFQMIVPKHWKNEKFKPICIHLAGTGDHYYWRRRNLMVKPLLKKGIGSIILENPYYGLRKPKHQFYSGLLYVSDVFVMGGCLILECMVLLNMAERLGFGPLGVTGLSMGGHMASLVATFWPKPLVVVPCLSWTTASSVFTEGVISNAIEWDFLQKEYFSNEKYYKFLAKLCKIVDDPTACGLVRLPNFISNLTDFKSRFSQEFIAPYDIQQFMGVGKEDIPVAKYRRTRLLYYKKFDGAVERLVEKVFKEKNAMKLRDQHALWFMRGLMDEFTHLKNYPIPIDTNLIVAICARCDAYVPREGCAKLEELWPGITIKYLNCGHVGAFLKYMDYFRINIVECFKKYKKNYLENNLVDGKVT